MKRFEKVYSNRYFPHYAIPGKFIAYDGNGFKQHFDSEAEAIEYSNEPMTGYKGYQISSVNMIFKNGVQVFTAPWQYCSTIYEAKAIIDSSFEFGERQRQTHTQQYREMAGTCGHDLNDDAERFERWNEQQSQLQLLENEY